MFLFLFLFLFSCHVSNDPLSVVTIENKTYSSFDFFSEFNYKEWVSADSSNKHQMLNLFIKKELCFLEAKNLALHSFPDVIKKIHDRSYPIIIQSTYDYGVAKKKLGQQGLSRALGAIEKQVLVRHLLISFRGSRLRAPFNRTKDEALLKATEIYQELNNNTFNALVQSYSEDPAALKNRGLLGWVGFGQTIKPFQDVIFDLPVGVVSDPVLTDFGYHLILVDSVRASEFKGLSRALLEDVVVEKSQRQLMDILKKDALEYDSLALDAAQLKLNMESVQEVYRHVNQEILNNRVAGKGSFNYIEALESFPSREVLCVYNNKGFGVNWFVGQIQSLPSHMHPKFNSLEDFISIIKTVVLQELAYAFSNKNSLGERVFYKNKLHKAERSVLYGEYLKFLVNSVEVPDSLVVLDYYTANKETKYIEKERVVVQELRVENVVLLDSLHKQIQQKQSLQAQIDLFRLYCEKYSKTNPRKQGLLNPFGRGRFGVMGEVAWSLDVNGFSDIIKNEDNTCSLIFLKELYSGGYVPFPRVYKQIESLLTKQAQDKIKVSGVDGLFEKYNFNINKDFFSF